MMAFMLAPSMYSRPPASWTTRATSMMSVSKSPRVLGLVIMMPAVVGPTASRRTPRSRRPSDFDAMVTGFMPAITTEAGLVPWAESGMSTSMRSASPLARWKARMASMPRNSPWAPAAGCRLQAAKPVISHKASWSNLRAQSNPWMSASSCSGWRVVKPGRAATRSLIRGLYFMVQLPRGYRPRSI